jgi:hypothetical protein
MLHFLDIPVVTINHKVYDPWIEILTIAHLVPSRANLDGFLPIKDWGFDGRSGFFAAGE